jgi:hypothetical protein
MSEFQVPYSYHFRPFYAVKKGKRTKKGERKNKKGKRTKKGERTKKGNLVAEIFKSFSDQLSRQIRHY